MTPEELSLLHTEFSNNLLHRLKIGREEYGDASFEKSLGSIGDEILEELLDVAGWAFIAWAKMRLKLARLELREKANNAQA